MDLRKRLTQGQDAAAAGRYKEALDEYVWFHDHALDHDRAFYGVRLSFALSYWMDLGKAYPPALRKLSSIRDRKTRLLSKGKGTRDLFHDVESINQCLGEGIKTYQLLGVLEANAPELAKQCGSIAIDCIVEAGDFQMAKRHWPHPENGLLQFSDQLNDDVSEFRADPNRYERALMAYTHIYCNRVWTTVRIAEGLGYDETAELTREWAVALVRDRHVRNKVQKILSARPNQGDQVWK